MSKTFLQPMREILSSIIIHKTIDLRKELHKNAERSGKENKTNYIVKKFLSELPLCKIVGNVGGYGILALYSTGSNIKGRSILLRADIDALPIEEENDFEHTSMNPGVSHKCGHDGHTAILCGLAMVLSQNPSLFQNVNIYLLFQPAEETGEGAVRVLEDKIFKEINIDFVYALHNLPGFPKSSIVMRKEVFASASIGLIVRLNGVSAHASEPQNGVSPALAVAALINTFSSSPQYFTSLQENAKVTIIHAQVGEIAFGTSPSKGVLMATLRAFRQETLDKLKCKCTELAMKIGESFALKVNLEWTEEFPETKNNDYAHSIVTKAAEISNLSRIELELPFAWSEDFGNFTKKYKGCLFGLGAGSNHPALHNPKYDFPDRIITSGVEMFYHIISQHNEDE